MKFILMSVNFQFNEIIGVDVFLCLKVSPVMKFSKL